MKLKLKQILVAILLLVAPMSAVGAESLRLAKIFSDCMVLQQQTDAPIWGWSKPSAKVVVKPSWSSRSYTVKADNGTFGLSNVAATMVNLLGYEAPDMWDESIIEVK